MRKLPIVFLILICCGTTSLAQMKITDSAKTAAGVIRIVKVEENSFTVVLNSKIVEKDGVSYVDGSVITNEENTYVSFGLRFTVGAAEVLFLESTLGGSASGTTHRIITIWKDGAISVSPYIGNGAAPKITRQEKSLSIYFPAVSTIEGRMPAESWVWTDGKTKRVRSNSGKR